MDRMSALIIDMSKCVRIWINQFTGFSGWCSQLIRQTFIALSLRLVSLSDRTARNYMMN